MVIHQVRSLNTFKGEIHQKVMGKQTIYVQKQNDLPCPDPEELRSLDKEIETIREKLSALKEEVKSKTALLSTLKGSKTNKQIKESIEAIKIEVNFFKITCY